MLKRSSSTPVRPIAPVIEEPISRYQQPLQPGPLSSSIVLPFDIGSTIVNPIDGSAYHLIQPLGNGSYAVVYMVREKNTGKFYALKCLSKANLSDYHLEVQHNEVRLHEQLSHFNIVNLENYFETPDWLFLVLEYCEGQDLYYWLTQNHDGENSLTGKILSDKERMVIVKRVFVQILDAVGYCHKNGVAHRDLKPENFIVMIKDDDEFKGIQVKLTDFGLATDEKESVDFDCGSKPYMSYECRNPIHDTYNPRLADIWSLGIILINLLYHRSPWADPNPEECKSFISFQMDKVDFLIQRFPAMPKKVAQFFASRVFCNVEDRIGIEEWKNWCNKFVERMSDEVEIEDIFEVQTSISRESSSYYQRQRGHDRIQSWSDVVGDFENEMDFNNKHSSHPSLKELSQSTKLVEVGIEKKIEKQEETKFTEKDKEYENQVENANNSDADSGFGTDEEINGGNHHNIIKGPKEFRGFKVSNENINPAKVTLSVSPPKVIVCKPTLWGDYRSRGHQRESSTDNDPTVSNVTNNNNHWSSYNQRRERLEQRRKEKQEQTLNSLGAYRRRGSFNVDTGDSVDNSARKRLQRPSNLNPEGIYTTPPRRNAPRNRSPLRRKSSQSNNNFPLATSPKLSINSPQSDKSIINSNISKQRTPTSFDKTPKKVGRSTKNHLGKMLAGVVMFNRSVKVGGQVNENN